MNRTLSWSAVLLLISVATVASADAPEGSTWKYYRTGNTGVMGDYSEALWIAPDDTPYICCYVPTFEEGGLSIFHEKENRWENISSVDYPVFGDREIVGTARISDVVPDANGALWMGTWIGALYYDPAVGPSSLIRYDEFNSPLPGGRTVDVSIAPDGAVWFGIYGGGVARFFPDTGIWTVWGYGSNANGWPGWNTTRTAAVQPKTTGGYFVWVTDAFGNAVYDSDTDSFAELPNNDLPGEIKGVPHDDACDEMGNCWMYRFTAPGQGYSLDYRRADGTWVVPPQPPMSFYSFDAFRAFGDRKVVLIGGNSEAWYFNGTLWSNLGSWRDGGFTYGIDMDSHGNVWVSGNGGCARRNAVTGQWQRYRVTNTSLMDYWPRDIAFAPNGDVWVTENASPGVGGIGVFDGVRWHNHNILHYGLGEDWPYPCDNADAITFRASTGRVAFNPMYNGIREWDGDSYSTLETGSISDGLVEDSFGRLWTIDNYFNLRYYDESGFHDVEIAGWGANVVKDPDRPGTVWACANFEVVRSDGIYYFSREVPDFPELNPMHDVLTTVAAAPNGIAWVGSSEGLFRVDANAGTHQWWHESNSDLPGDQVTPLAVSPDGLVWFTNFLSNGFEPALVWFDGEQFGTITQEQGLPHAQIYDAEVREVPGGYEIWFACPSRGIGVLTVPMGNPASAQETEPDRRFVLTCTPNPSASTAEFSFSTQKPGRVRLDLFDVSGRLVRRLVEGEMAAGPHIVRWDNRDDLNRRVEGGVYFYRLETDHGKAQGRMTVVR